ncbi:MAG: hypothetical protein A2285_04310 [Elusimicrobia bacterium RIFOXYA12_FULL_57_11]|nr:MAG: hypothetical protein A2285_04310 [Elusimicrobia bacterium RIFOXYA12_FULL_57_11]
MPDQKVLLITANAGLSAAAAGAFASVYIQLVVLTSCAKFPVQDKPKFILVLLDMDSLGAAKMSELRAFLARMRGLPVIALCDMAKTPNKDTVEILSTGVNDVIPNAINMNLLIAKTRAHLRRLGAGNNAATDRAAGGWTRGDGI